MINTRFNFQFEVKRKMGEISIRRFFLLIGCIFLLSTSIVLTLGSSSAELLKRNLLLNANKLLGKREYFSNDLCLTKTCIESATEILNNMDESQDPCDNFYMFACGQFVNKTEIPESKTIITSVTKLKEKLDQQLKELVESPIEQNEAKPFQLVKKIYQSCIQTDKIEDNGLNPLRKIIDKLGTWPVLQGNNWDSKNFSWTETIFKIKEIGFSVDYLIDFSIITDLKHARRIVSLDRGELGIKREYLLNGAREREVEAYNKFQVELAVNLGAGREFALKEMTDVLNFERALANFSATNEQRRNETNFYNPMTIRELQSRYPYMNWIDYINNLLPENTKVDENEIVTVAEPYYLYKFGELISTIDKRIIANYLILRVVEDSANYLDSRMRNVQFNYLSSLTGVQSQTPRWKECIRVITSSLLANAIGVLYVKNHFDEAAKEAAWGILSNIHSVFLHTLNETKWMDPITKSRAYKKATSMSADVGYPEELMNATLLDRLYNGLEFEKNSYLENILELLKIMTRYSFVSLRQQFNESLAWVTVGRPAQINAYYDRLGNSMNFPAGILQGNLFDPKRPMYLNYGSLGWVCGHEIGHAFDDRGRQFDGEGNLNNWWEESTEVAFLEKADCIVKQYSGYSIEGSNIHLNGYNTQGENIADIGGIKEAYKAYQLFVQQNGVEKSLPQIKYTQNQLFWVSAANVYCNKIRPEAYEQEVLLGSHSLGEFRVIGSFSNMKEFSSDFNCKLGSKMNPIHKCTVW